MSHTTDRLQYDVFLSHAAIDMPLAVAVRERMTASGLTVFSPTGVQLGQELSTAIRAGVMESLTVVVVLTSEFARQPNLFVELGVAWGLETPIFVLFNESDPPDSFPVFLRKYPAYPLWNGFPALLAAIPRRGLRINDSQRSELIASYQAVGVPVDRLITSPKDMSALTEQFRASTGLMTRPSELLSELLRLRKRSRLLPMATKSAS